MMISTQDQQIANQVAELFATLGDPSRVRIIGLLLEGEKNVGTLAETLEMSISSVSHHLRTLRQMRIVRGRREGREVFYSLDDLHVADLFQRGLDHILHS